MGRQGDRAREVADELVSIALDNVFNPYRDVCPLHDSPQSPCVRRQNVEAYIRWAFTARPSTAWVGRDLGYRGGRRTGLPLTDEAHLPICARIFQLQAARKATRTEAMRERTAAEIWRVVRELNDPPFLWNAFPFHPHGADDPLNNRCHTRREFLACEDLFVALFRWLNFERVFALGNDAARALARIGIAFVCVRHPSYGGQNAFRQHMADAYALKAECGQMEMKIA